MSKRLEGYPIKFGLRYLAPHVDAFLTGPRTIECVFSLPIRPVPADRGAILRKFVNADSSDETILEFARQYGPIVSNSFQSEWVRLLTPELIVKGQVHRTFDAESVRQVWRDEQTFFRHMWHGLSIRNDDWNEASRIMHWGGELNFENNALVYRARCLQAYLFMSATLNRTRLRVCAREDCPNKYFLAKHGPQKYCDAASCAEAASRESKLKWWNKEGKRRAARRSQKSRRKA